MARSTVHCIEILIYSIKTYLRTENRKFQRADYQICYILSDNTVLYLRCILYYLLKPTLGSYGFVIPLMGFVFCVYGKLLIYA
jgi:hypothetical protein